MLRNLFTRKRLSLISGAVLFALCVSASTRGGLVQSWENPEDPTFGGWTIPTSENPSFSAFYENTVGVTNGMHSLRVSLTDPLLTPPATGTPNTVIDDGDMLPNGQTVHGPTYGQMFRSPFQQDLTTQLAHASQVQFDINVPNPGPNFAVGAFNYYLQFDVVANNNDMAIGYRSLDNFTFSDSANIGGQKTLRFNIPLDLRTALAASTSATQLILQVGGGYAAAYNASGNLQFQETFYIDNVRLGYNPGDFNFDGHVDQNDIPVMLTALTDLPTYQSANFLSDLDLQTIGDFDLDTFVTNADMQGWIGNLLAGGGSGSLAAVPEPASLALIALALPALALVARRRRCQLQCRQ